MVTGEKPLGREGHSAALIGTSATTPKLWIFGGKGKVRHHPRRHHPRQQHPRHPFATNQPRRLPRLRRPHRPPHRPPRRPPHRPPHHRRHLRRPGAWARPALGRHALPRLRRAYRQLCVARGGGGGWRQQHGALLPCGCRARQPHDALRWHGLARTKEVRPSPSPFTPKPSPQPSPQPSPPTPSPHPNPSSLIPTSPPTSPPTRLLNTAALFDATSYRWSQPPPSSLTDVPPPRAGQTISVRGSRV